MSDVLIISPDCMSSSHNTLSAAYSKRGRPACTCPHTLALLEKERERQREANRNRRAANGQDGDIRRGQARVPRWQKEVGHLPVDPECPARGHNTLSWARGGHSGREARCICSHAQKVLAQYREERRARERQQTAGRDEPRSLPRIDWKGALCSRPENVKVADGGFDERKTWLGITARTKAKELCRACPLFDSGECENWIRKAEHDDPGSLGGVYAGMDVWDRRGTPVVWVNGRWRSGAAA